MPNEFSLRSSPVPLSEMDERQYSEWLKNQKVANFKNGQTGYNTGVGYFLGDDSGIPKFSVGNSAGNKVTWDGSSLSITGTVTATSGSFNGGITIGSGGSLSSGQTAYNTGTGYWLESNAGTPRFSIGNPSTNFLTWDGTALKLSGSLDIAVQTYTPTWVGFSTAPTGTLDWLDFGSFAIIWTADDRLGTSGGTYGSQFRFTLPFTPSGARRGVSDVVDNGAETLAHWISTTAAGLQYVVFRNPSFLESWTASGTKGIYAGWLIVIPK